MRGEVAASRAVRVGAGAGLEAWARLAAATLSCTSVRRLGKGLGGRDPCEAMLRGSRLRSSVRLPTCSSAISVLVP